MKKKCTYAVIGAALLMGVLYGGNLLPYAQTAFNQVRQSAEDAVPISFQIESAKTQLGKIGPEINDMVQQIAKEKAQIKKLTRDLDEQKQVLTKRYDQMMTLKNHVSSGEEVYVATNGKAYTSERVKEDLRHRFTLYKTAEKTIEKSEQILSLRQEALEAAFAKLDEAQAQERELQVQIENLTARQAMIEVAATASNINIDNSELAKTRDMIDQISTRLDESEEMMSLAPQYLGGQIPVNEEILSESGDILDEMDAYFAAEETGEMVSK